MVEQTYLAMQESEGEKAAETPREVEPD